MLLHEMTYEAARSVAMLPAAARLNVLERLETSDLVRLKEAARTDWGSYARKKQRLPKGDWRWCIFMAGRSWGKTLAGAQAIRAMAESGEHEWLSIVGPTVNNLHRDMLFGPSGLMTISPRWYLPQYMVQRNELRYPVHPVTGLRPRVALLSADRPDRIRGSQCSFCWCDEPQSWTKAKTAFEMTDLSLRLGKRPHGVVSMTPKGTTFVRDLILGTRDRNNKRHPRKDAVVIRGISRENVAIEREVFDSLEASLDPGMVKQELEAVLVEAPKGALWIQETIDRFRVPGVRDQLVRVVVGLDPSRSAAGIGDEAGIVAAGRSNDGHIYILEDGTVRGGPLRWASAAAGLALKYTASEVCFEANAVSADIAAVIRQVAGETRTRWEPVQATAKKEVRAAPVAMQYEAGLVHHVGVFEVLEDEMTTWDPTDTKSLSPNRVDALVWACTQLSPSKVKRPLAYA